MMKNTSKEIIIRLEGEDVEDGRIYVTSPDLRGFYFVLEDGESPNDAMIPELKTFLPLYLNAEINALRPAITMREFRASWLNIPALLGNHSYNMIAEVA